MSKELFPTNKAPKALVVIDEVPELIVVHRVVVRLLHIDLEPVQAQVSFLHLAKSLPLNHDDLTAIHYGDSSSTVLNLISCQLHDLNSVELPQSLTELDLTANRLSPMDTHIATLSSLTKLSFRQNLFKNVVVKPISAWIALSGLEELVLRDNS
ncbi:hypothetical protein ACLB2K_007894 [Fragaria x ananassa]